MGHAVAGLAGEVVGVDLRGGVVAAPQGVEPGPAHFGKAVVVVQKKGCFYIVLRGHAVEAQRGIVAPPVVAVTAQQHAIFEVGFQAAIGVVLKAGHGTVGVGNAGNAQIGVVGVACFQAVGQACAFHHSHGHAGRWVGKA